MQLLINENITTHSRYMFIHMCLLNCLNTISHNISFLSPFKNCSKNFRPKSIGRYRISIEVYRYHQNKPRQESRYKEINIILVHNVQACHEIKMSIQENPMTSKPSQADTDQ